LVFDALQLVSSHQLIYHGAEKPLLLDDADNVGFLFELVPTLGQSELVSVPAAAAGRQNAHKALRQADCITPDSLCLLAGEPISAACHSWLFDLEELRHHVIFDKVEVPIAEEDGHRARQDSLHTTNI